MPTCKTCSGEIAIGAQFIREGYDAEGKMILHHRDCWKGEVSRVFTMNAVRADVVRNHRAEGKPDSQNLAQAPSEPTSPTAAIQGRSE